MTRGRQPKTKTRGMRNDGKLENNNIKKRKNINSITARSSSNDATRSTRRICFSNGSGDSSSTQNNNIMTAANKETTRIIAAKAVEAAAVIGGNINSNRSSSRRRSRVMRQRQKQIFGSCVSVLRRLSIVATQLATHLLHRPPLRSRRCHTAARPIGTGEAELSRR